MLKTKTFSNNFLFYSPSSNTSIPLCTCRSNWCPWCWNRNWLKRCRHRVSQKRSASCAQEVETIRSAGNTFRSRASYNWRSTYWGTCHCGSWKMWLHSWWRLISSCGRSGSPSTQLIRQFSLHRRTLNTFSNICKKRKMFYITSCINRSICK